MCDGAGSPVSVSQALGILHRALDHLNAADVASLPSSVQAEALRALEGAEAKHTAARARVLAGFTDSYPGAAGGSQASPGPVPLSPETRDRLRRALLGLAADALSGPGGLAARLRAALDSRPLTTISLPLDIGAATETIPAHLRRAAATRHPRCAFPGCDQPATVCDIHHIVPRCRGGPTALHNLVPLCGFHHQIAVHRWGWILRLNPDGTTTATSPDRTRTLHSHGPPPSQAA